MFAMAFIAHAAWIALFTGSPYISAFSRQRLPINSTNFFNEYFSAKVFENFGTILRFLENLVHDFRGFLGIFSSS